MSDRLTEEATTTAVVARKDSKKRFCSAPNNGPSFNTAIAASVTESESIKVRADASVPSFQTMMVPDKGRECCLNFMAIGDFGEPTEDVGEVAQAMANTAECPQRVPSFILTLGDNFYPDGVESVDDEQFQKAWRDVFLCHPSLRIPWKVCLGNHDIYGNAQAQIDYTYSAHNTGGFWQCPSNNYEFSVPCMTPGGHSTLFTVDFFCLDTNGCQQSCLGVNPNMRAELFQAKKDLAKKLRRSTAQWKIVFGHHPMYTKGRNHGLLGDCLRDDFYKDKRGNERQGFGMESVLIDGGVDAYITGHEHVAQHRFANGVHHFVSGSGGVFNDFYGGEDRRRNQTWVDRSFSTSFLSVKATYNALTFQFISSKSKVLYEVVLRK